MMVCNSISVLKNTKEIAGYYTFPFSTESARFHYIFQTEKKNDCW